MTIPTRGRCATTRPTEKMDKSWRVARVRIEPGCGGAVPRNDSTGCEGSASRNRRMVRQPRPGGVATKRSRFVQQPFTKPRAKSPHQTRSDGNAQLSSRRGAVDLRDDGSKRKRYAPRATIQPNYIEYSDSRLRVWSWIPPFPTRLLPTERPASL